MFSLWEQKLWPAFRCATHAGSKGDGKSRLFSPSQGTAHAILICSHPFLSPPSPTISHRLSLALLFFWWWMAMAIDADGRRCTLRGDSIAANGRPCTLASRGPYGRGKKHNSTAPLPIRRCPRVATRASPSMGTTTLDIYAWYWLCSLPHDCVG